MTTNEALNELAAQTKILAVMTTEPKRLPELAELAGIGIDAAELAINQIWTAGLCERRTLANGAWHYCKKP